MRNASFIATASIWRALAISCPLLFLAGCDSVPECDDTQVIKTLINVVDELLDKGLKPSEQEALRSIKVTSVLTTASKGVEKSARTCTGRILVTLDDPVAKQLNEMTENGEEIADEWEGPQKAILEDMRKRTLGIPPYSVLDVSIEIASRYADANMAFIRDSQELRGRISTLRDVWNSKDKAMETVTEYMVLSDSGKNAFSVQLSGRDFAQIVHVIPLALKLSGAIAKPSAANGGQLSAKLIAIPLKQGMVYADARRNLLQKGWVPQGNEKPRELGYFAQALFAQGIAEVAMCADTGVAPCLFVWANPQNGQKLVVHTVGDQLPEVESWTIK